MCMFACAGAGQVRRRTMLWLVYGGSNLPTLVHVVVTGSCNAQDLAGTGLVIQWHARDFGMENQTVTLLRMHQTGHILL